MMDESIKNKFEGGKQSNSSQNIKVVKRGKVKRRLLLEHIMTVLERMV